MRGRGAGCCLQERFEDDKKGRGGVIQSRRRESSGESRIRLRCGSKVWELMSWSVMSSAHARPGAGPAMVTLDQGELDLNAWPAPTRAEGRGGFL